MSSSAHRLVQAPAQAKMLAFQLTRSLPLHPLRQFPSFSYRSRHRLRFVVTAASQPPSKKRVVFLGTPQVAANALQRLHAASTDSSATFLLAGVVTQPPAPAGRKRTITKSPVHQIADELSLSPVMTPSSAKDPDFLSALTALAPDLCITAAYGNFLPTAFLDIPPFGTLNIHPSLLPAFRGAAPVPRALEAGVSETGVTILSTVLKMDAGPIVTRVVRPLSGDEQAPELLQELFNTGTDALLEMLPALWDGSVHLQPQDEALATHAPKLAKHEARLTFTETAHIVHDKVRAFAGWPGTWGEFRLLEGDEIIDVTLKVIRTVILRPHGGMCLGVHDVSFNEDHDCLDVTCDDGSKIGVLEVQPLGKRVMSARAFWNGLRGKNIERKRVPH